MNQHRATVAGNASSTADLQDIAAFDRLAGQLASPATLRRYARQHRADTAGSAKDGWLRVLSALR